MFEISIVSLGHPTVSLTYVKKKPDETKISLCKLSESELELVTIRSCALVSLDSIK